MMKLPPKKLSNVEIFSNLDLAFQSFAIEIVKLNSSPEKFGGSLDWQNLTFVQDAWQLVADGLNSSFANPHMIQSRNQLAEIAPQSWESIRNLTTNPTNLPPPMDLRAVALIQEALRQECPPTRKVPAQEGTLRVLVSTFSVREEIGDISKQLVLMLNLGMHSGFIRALAQDSDLQMVNRWEAQIVATTFITSMWYSKKYNV